MTVGVCLSCAELFDGSKVCPRCGSRLTRRRQDFLSWEGKRQHARIDAWCKDGVIGDLVAERLHAAVDHKVVVPAAVVPAEAAAPPPAHPGRASAIERGADGMMTGAGSLYREMGERWTKLARAIEAEGPPAEERAMARALERDDRTLDAGRAVFAREGSAVVGAGVEALAALDDPEEPDSKGVMRPAQPFGALQVFWFIGTVLVLAGSVMGVREAWRSLEGVWRPVVIASAFFAYHVLFVGLARLLVKRSRVTGRVLTGVAAGLLPVVFVAVAVAVGQRASVGVPFAAVLLVASAVSLLQAGKVADRAATGVALAFGLVPALVLELFAGYDEAPPSRRGLLVILALVPVVALATRARSAPRGSALVGVLAATYGAVAVAILGLFGGPGADALTSLPDAEGGAVATPALVGWIALFAASAWWTSTGPAVVQRLRGAAPVPLLLSLAALVGTSIAALVLGLGAPDDSVMFVRYTPIGVVVLTTGILAFDQRQRPGALHVLPFVALFAALLTARQVFSESAAATWVACCAIVPAAYLAASAIATDRRRRAITATWGILLGGVVTVVTIGLEAVGRRDADANHPYTLGLAVASVLAVTAHLAAKRTRPSLHVAGSLFAFVALLTWRLPLSTTFASGLWCAVVLAAGYGILALGYETIASKEDDRRPLDDVSLFFALGALWLAVINGAFSNDSTNANVVPIAALAALLFARALRDRSALVVMQGAFAAALALHSWLQTSPLDLGEQVAFLGFCAGASAVLAAFRQPRADGPRFGRAIYGLVPLPLSGPPRALLDGFALASVAFAFCALAGVVAWLGVPQRNEVSRSIVLAGLAGVLATGAAAFATRAFELFLARGSVVTLGLLGPVIGLTAVSYRIGRPLPPDVVGFRLSIVLALVWLLARGIVKVGPRIGRALDRPDHGPHYHHVAHAGVVALALLLFVDAVLVGGPTLERTLAVTPPTLLVGSALGLYLLYRSYGREPLLHLAAFLTTGASALAGAQQSLYGRHLSPLDLPGGRWVPDVVRARPDWLEPVNFLEAGDSVVQLHARACFGAGAALFGIAVLLVALTRAPAFARFVRERVFARDEAAHSAIERGFASPLVIVSMFLALGLVFRPDVPAAVAFAIVGLVAAAATSPSYRTLPLVFAAPLVVHAFGFNVLAFAPWAGAAYALLALGSVVIGRQVSKSRGHDPRALGKTQLVAAGYAVLALIQVIDARFTFTMGPAAALAILGVATAAAGLAWKNGLTRILSVGPALFFALAGGAFTEAFTGQDLIPPLVSRDGALLAATLAIAMASAHGFAIATSRAGREDASWGFALGRDIVLVTSGLVMSLFVATRTDGGFLVGSCGTLALGLAVAVSVHTIAWRGTGRHVAIVEALVVAFYAFATRSMRPRPEIDALIGLLYGFSLLGVAVLARRRGVTNVAVATRRFTAALPLFLFFVTSGTGAGNLAASLALGASFLYGAMALAERSRIFGSLAALAANLALIAFAVAQGLDGVEVYVGPLGILVTALSQIFAPKMSVQARSALRILGGALLYLPAGVKLTFQLGEAADGTYSVVFGTACLIGVVAGLALQVRAYLALGTLFLTLDVLANLVHAGLRDHRVGFVLLSLSGLAILGTMIGITLLRDRAWAAVGRLRFHMRAWD